MNTLHLASNTCMSGLQNDGGVAVATVPHGDAHDDNMIQLNVQQQVIMHSDGTRVQIVRLVQLGQPQPVDPHDFQKHMLALEGEVPDVLNNVVGGAEGIQGDAPLEDLEQKFGEMIGKVVLSQQDSNLRDALNQGQGSPEGHQGPGAKQDHSDHRHVDAGRHQDLLQQQRQQEQQQQPNSQNTVFDKVSEIKVKSLIDSSNHINDKTNPPESIFRKLAPSRDRYTLLKEEL